MADRFGINSYQWGSEGGSVKLHQGQDAYDPYLAAQKNPEQYTRNQPNGGAKAAFTFDDWSSSGIDDNDWDEKISFYKIPQPEPAPTPAPAPAPAPTPTPEPVKEEPKGPVEYSPEIQKAKEKVQQYESNIKSGNTSEQIYDPNRKYAQETNLDFGNNLDFSAKEFDNA